MKEVDKDTNGPFGKITSFGECLIKLSSIGWVNSVAFSPSGSSICYASKYSSINCFVAHDCELNFVDVSKAAEKVKAKPEKVFYKGNPFLKGILSEQ